MEKIDYKTIFEYQHILKKFNTQKEEDIISIKNFINDNFSILSDKLKVNFLKQIIEINEYSSSHLNCTCEDCNLTIEDKIFDRWFECIRIHHGIYLEKIKSLPKD